MARLISLAIRAYRCTLGTVLPDSCRFTPTCSQYALDAVAAHGALHGTWLALKRLLRCHPFHPGGYDPVPARCGAHERNLPQ